MQGGKLSEALRQLRSTNGWSMETLAKKIGVSLQTVYRWENQKTIPSQLAREKLEFLGVKV